MLTDDQDQLLDRLQKQALKIIYGSDFTYMEMRDRAGVTTLRQRRVELSDKFVAKCLKTPRFQGWFPEMTGRMGRG